MEKLKVLSLFSGIGAFEKALTNIGIDYELVNYCEIDKYASKSYAAIHNVDESLNLGDITKININKLPNIDIITHGSPCQSWSVAGKQEGGDKGSGTRSSLMWNTVEIVKQSKPKYVIWENVKNVLSKKHIHNFNQYLDELQELGYTNYYKVLNAKDFGIPQNRERIFVISIFGEHNKYDFPERMKLEKNIKDILECNVDEKYYMNNEKAKEFLEKVKENEYCNKNKNYIPEENLVSYPLRSQEFVRIGFEENCPTLSARDYKDPKIVREPVRLGGIFDDDKGKHQAGSVWDDKYISPTLDTMQGGWRQPCILCEVVNQKSTMDSEEVPAPNQITKNDNIIIDDTQGFDGIRYYNHCPTLRASRSGLKTTTNDLRIRKLTPKECWRLMGFEDSDIDKCISVGISNTQLYKQAGNSIVVNVLEEIFKNLLLSSNKSQTPSEE